MEGVAPERLRCRKIQKEFAVGAGRRRILLPVYPKSVTMVAKSEQFSVDETGKSQFL